MKTSQDPRHRRRIKIMQDLFAWDFNQNSRLDTQTAPIILQNLQQIDESIVQAAPAWPLEKINKIDLAILRVAILNY